ncbi:MAG: class I SAM-dependent methyltransferase [bacterium]|nr:class I SAM-dependent methyltransferase [bacterium]
MDYNIVHFRNVAVYYHPNLDGGGITFGQEYIQVVKEKIGKVNHIFEFCAGPGFIGFSLLANGLCDRLTLADINPEAVKACKETVKRNNLGSKVSVYQSDCLDQIPESEKWDLVVGNPPHWWTASEEVYKSDIRKFDPDLRIHKRFYKDIKRFLKPDGTVLLQENKHATRSEDFIPMIKENGLEIIEIFRGPTASVISMLLKGKNPKWRKSGYYFIWCKAK